MPKDQRWGLYILSRLLAPFSNNAWFLTSSVLMLAGLTVGCLYLWQTHKEKILSKPEFKLTQERLIVTHAPKWIASDVVADTMVRGRLHGLNVLDADFSLRVDRAFRANPWVRDVLLVNPSQALGRGVVVNVEWRRPVAFVVVDARKYGQDYPEGLLPIDKDGVLLPQEIPGDEANQYPKIGGVDSEPVRTGHPWGDPRVVDAAKIAILLEDMWHDLGLRRIDVPSIEESKSTEAFFQLVLASGESTVWGSAPGKERGHECSAAEKVLRLRQILKGTGESVSQAVRDVDLREIRWASRGKN
ncbi:MAG: hypothetical protein KDB27_10765 [Planctomycetales bacterium]|nr:hypothetical protein [Planctomycetales bacterium]